MIFLAIALTILGCIAVFNLKSPGKRIEHEIEPQGTLDSPNIKRSIGQLLGPPLVDGNLITRLENGDEIFPAMLAAIRGAQVSITFETFIYWSGAIGREVAEALSERARAGVHVHVLLDWIGANKFEASRFEEMRRAGVMVEWYRPLRWYNVSRINNRTHRKILVIDGKIGFTGGVGIADQWRGHAQDEDHWRDCHFRVEGPVVAHLQAAFTDNWNATRPEVLHGNSYFPALEAKGSCTAQVFKSSPEEGSGSVRLMFLYSIAHAAATIRIASAYFVPDSHVRACLIAACKSGVEVEVIVPGKYIDTAITRRASRAVWGDLLKAGVKIYEYQETMFHSKYMIVDKAWVSVGSTNFDNRSFRLNDECNLNVIDAEWGQEMAEMFARDKARAKEITYAAWEKRPLLDKVIENLAFLARSQV
ncbi:MAG: cardiolipin synthase [Proteobacteria bacterium]|nr:MAG: cardiolipin synthase [Pseudomonadota bacterium]